MNRRFSAVSDALSASVARVGPRLRQLRRLAFGHAWQRHPVTRLVTRSLLGIAVLGVIILVSTVRHYQQKAAAYDLNILQEKGVLRVLDRQGAFVGTLDPKNRVPLIVTDLPPYVVSALLATEDARFFEHRGVDYRGIARAAVTNFFAGGRVKQGGSTLTQQLARQVFKLRGRTFDRKMTEVFLAFRIEKQFSKEAILERYLNEVYFGNGYHGLGAASLGYFGKTAKTLSMAEAATLIGIIRSPVRFAPSKSPEDAKRLRNVVLQRMVVTGKVDAALADKVSKEPLKVAHLHASSYKQDYALAALNKELESQSETEPPTQLIYSGLDSTLQQRLTRRVREFVKDLRSSVPGSKMQAAVLVLDNKKGEILATIGGNDYAEAPFDRAMQARRSPGTAFFPVVAAAVATVKPNRLLEDVLDAPLDNRKVMVGGDRGTLAEWGGLHSTAVFHEGMIPAGYAFLTSRTGAMMRLGSELGTEKLEWVALQNGINTPLSKYPNAILGTTPIAMVELAHAFTALANDGRPSPKPHLLRTGNEKPVVEEGMPTLAARQVRILMQAYLRQEEFRSALTESGIDQWELAGYGGVSYGTRDAWFIGFSSEITCAVWIGNDDNQPLPKEQNWTLKASLLWAQAMRNAVSQAPPNWPEIQSTSLICLRSGEIAGHNCTHANPPLCVRSSAFTPRFNRHMQCHLHQPDAKLIPVAVTRMAEQPGGPLPDMIQPVPVRGAVVVGNDPYRQSMTMLEDKDAITAGSKVSVLLGNPAE